MRSEKAYLQDMAEALQELAVFVRDTDEAAFQRNPVLRKAVLMQLVIVGEAANHIGRPSRRSIRPYRGPMWSASATTPCMGTFN